MQYQKGQCESDNIYGKSSMTEEGMTPTTEMTCLNYNITLLSKNRNT